MKTSGLLLFICAGLLLSGGALLGGTTAWSLLRMSYYFWSTELGVELGGGALMLGGALLSLPACWLATLLPYQPRSTPLTFALMTLATGSLLSLSLGISSSAALARELRDPAALNASMLRALAYTGVDPAVRSAFSAMQIDLKCCGVHSPSDWYQIRGSLPPACCGKPWNGKRSEQCSSTMAPGCLRLVLWDLKNYVNSITVLASAIIIVLAVTLFSAAYSLVSALAAAEAARLKVQSLCLACLPASPSALLRPSPSTLLRPSLYPSADTQV